MIIRSGGNQFHGSAYYYNRNEALAASSPFSPEGASRDKLRNQQYGFSVGGPIIRNKTFFFTTFERQSFDIGNPTLSTEPSQDYQTAARNLLASAGVPVNPVSSKLLGRFVAVKCTHWTRASRELLQPGRRTGSQR